MCSISDFHLDAFYLSLLPPLNQSRVNDGVNDGLVDDVVVNDGQSMNTSSTHTTSIHPELKYVLSDENLNEDTHLIIYPMIMLPIDGMDGDGNEDEDGDKDGADGNKEDDESIILHDPSSTTPSLQLSIHYHPTYLTPTLYIVSSPPLPTTTLTKLYPLLDSSPGLEIITPSYHPTTSHPCHFLHPCNTPKILSTLSPPNPPTTSPLISFLSLSLPLLLPSLPTSYFPPLLSHIKKMRTHVTLHFDVNETLILSDSAGGDSYEDTVNKVITKAIEVRIGCELNNIYS